MREQLGKVLVALSYVAFFAVFALGVADYGLTRPDSRPFFNTLMAAVFALWLLGLLVSWRLPRTGFLPWIPALGLAAWGGGSVWLGQFFAAEEAEMTGLWAEAISFPETPMGLLYSLASIDPAASALASGTAAALLAGFLISIEIWRDPVWNRILLLVVLLVGLAITILFYLQQIVGEPFQMVGLRGNPTAFYIFNYHGNGASFLNVLWPVALAGAVYSAIVRSVAWTMWFFPPAVMFSAVFVNISKAGHLLAVVGVGTLALLLLLPIIRAVTSIKLVIRKHHLVVAAIPLLVILAASYLAVPWERWNRYLDSADGITSDTRYRAYAQFVRMIPDSGWAGFGPGTFEGTHLEYLREDPIAARAPFWVAHQDYIQTVIEWGWGGAALWVLIFAPGTLALLVCVVVRFEMPPLPRTHYGWGWWDPIRKIMLALPDPANPFLAAGLLTALAVTGLHAIGDFPFQVPSIGLIALIWVAAGWSRIFCPKPDEED